MICPDEERFHLNILLQSNLPIQNSADGNISGQYTIFSLDVRDSSEAKVFEVIFVATRKSGGALLVHWRKCIYLFNP